MALSAAEMQEAIIRNLPVKTGKSLEEWIQIAHALGIPKDADRIKKLKSEFGLGHVQAQTIVWRMKGEQPYVETAGYEEGIFSTPQSFELYGKWRDFILSLNPEIRIMPCKTYIPFYRKKQFAVLTSIKGQVVLGLHLEENRFPALAPAEKIGGSDRINKMMVIENTDFETIKPYIQAAFDTHP